MKFMLLVQHYGKQILSTLFFIFIATVYLHNMTRDIYSGDIGDLVTAGFVLGVPHPSGYPLFTLLGYIFSHLKLALPVVTKVTLINTIGSVIGLILLFQTSRTITKSYFLSFLTTSILAFSYLFWFHAEIPEVFGLNNLFVIIILSLSLYFHKKPQNRVLYALTFFCGLSLTHHQTILFLFPPLAVFLLMHYKFLLAQKRTIPYMFLFFFLGLTPYLYVPFAASHNPVINWDSASTFSNFIHLLLRKDYGGFATGVVNQIPIAVKLIHVHYYFTSLVTTFSYQTIFLAFIGLFYLIRKDRQLAFFLTFSFLFSGAFYAYYGANLDTTTTSLGVVERFFSLSFVVFIFFIPYGLYALKLFLEKYFSRPIFSLILLSYFIIVPFFMFRINYEKTDLSTTQIGNTFAQNIFNSVPNDAILFVSGDTTTFSVWYNYYVLQKRQDIHLINPAGVGGNYYLDQEINIYKKNHPKTPLNAIVSKTIEELAKKKRIFATYEINTIPLPKNTMLLPQGLVYEFVTKDTIPSEPAFLAQFETLWRTVRIKRKETLTPNEQNLVASEIPMFYANALNRIGDFLLSYYNDPRMAEHYYRRALWIDDENASSYAGLSLSLYKGYNDCSGAIDQMNTAISLYPIWEKYYTQLYIMENGCNVPGTVKQSLEREYQQYFHKSLKQVVQTISAHQK